LHEDSALDALSLHSARQALADERVQTAAAMSLFCPLPGAALVVVSGGVASVLAAGFAKQWAAKKQGGLTAPSVGQLLGLIQIYTIRLLTCAFLRLYTWIPTTLYTWIPTTRTQRERGEVGFRR
jgi:hypothetical protein